MKTLGLSLILLIFCLGFVSLCSAWGWETERDRYHSSGSSGERQLLSEVKALTFYSGKQTTGRRSAPLPQLNCAGGNACREFTPLVVQCVQVGDEQWRCETDLPNNLRLGPVEVNCEGYDYPEDPYILKGSCSLDYSLHNAGPTGSGGSNGGYNREPYYGYDQYGYERSSMGFASLAPLVMVGIVAYVLYRMCRNGSFGGAPGAVPFGGTGGFGPGFGGGGYPPGTGFPPGPGCGPTYPSSTGGPGFFSGMAAGGLMGYLFGNRRGYAPPAYRTSLFPGGGATYGGSGFGGGGFSGGSGGTRTAFSAGGTRRR